MRVRTQMYNLHPEHALNFKRLVSETCSSESALSMTKKMFSVKPCGTGTEIDSSTGELLDDKCINSVFAMVQQDKLPGTALLFDFVANTFFDMSKKGEPWVKKFAFVVAAGTAIMRQVCSSGQFMLFMFHACLVSRYLIPTRKKTCPHHQT